GTSAWRRRHPPTSSTSWATRAWSSAPDPVGGKGAPPRRARGPSPDAAPPRSLMRGPRGPDRSALLDERPVLELGVGALQLLACVHDDRAVPGDRLADRLAGHEQEPDPGVAGLHHHLVARFEQDERAIPGLLADHLLHRPGPVGQDAKRRRGVTERAASLEHVGERIAPRVDRERL